MRTVISTVAFKTFTLTIPACTLMTGGRTATDTRTYALYLFEVMKDMS